MIVDHDVDDMSFGVGFTQLSTVRLPTRDPWPEVMDVNVWVRTFLRARDAQSGGRVTRFADERLDPAMLPLFKDYLRA